MRNDIEEVIDIGGWDSRPVGVDNCIILQLLMCI